MHFETPMYISVHIPKTAGSTIANILNNVFTGSVFLDYGGQYNYFDVQTPPFNIILKRAIKSIRRSIRYRKPKTCRCIHGHFKATKYYNMFSDTRLMTWIRHPASRVISHYFYWKANPDMGHTVCRQLIMNDLSLLDFAALPSMRNLQSLYLDSIPLSDFAFVGVQEHFNEILPHFFYFLGKKQIPYTSKMVNKSSNNNFDGYILSEINLLNQNDLNLYEYALHRAATNGWISQKQATLKV